MKEYPMLFNGSMVRAIMDDSKTQTRRIMKRQPNIDPQTGDWLFIGSDGSQEVHPIEQWIEIQTKLHFPYGKVGNRIWVKETFGIHPDFNPPYNFDGPYVYRATDPDWQTTENWKWKPSIHMPRAASRILLEITGVRPELLTDISDADAIAEGIESFRPAPGDGPAETLYRNYRTGKWTVSPRKSFYTLWESIHGPDSYGANPWVWAITFKIIAP